MSVAALFGATGSAAAATRLVDDDHAQCPNAHYSTIQAGVDAAAPGDTVLVCNGLYDEHVVVGAGKDALRVIAKTVHGAVVRADNPFRVEAHAVEISRFLIEGNGPGTGAGVSVGFSNESGDIGSTKTIRYNLIRRVARGVDLDDAGGGNIVHNTIQEFGDTGVAALSGSGLSEGANARIASNTIIGTPGSTGVRIATGHVGSFARAGGSVVGNQILGNQGAGTGIVVDNALVDRVGNNLVFDNGTGLMVAFAGPEVSHNKINANERQGILASFAGGRFVSNDARSNGGLDCEDQTPGGVTWTNNRGLDASPPGICTPGSQSGPRPTAHRLVVDDDRAQCPAANFTSIQAAVDSASPGDTVLVCNGAYPEDVTIGSGKDGIRVLANTIHEAIVRSFTTNVPDVQISRFLIQGDGSGTGINVEPVLPPGSGPAAIRDNLIRRFDTGIRVDQARVQHIERNTIQEFDSSGIDAFVPGQGFGATVDAKKNTIIGTPTSTGIRFSRLGFASTIDGDVVDNDVFGNGGAGISGGDASFFVDANSNRVFANGRGIEGQFNSVSRNIVHSNEQQGLLLGFVSNPIRSNDARGNGGVDCQDTSGPGSGTGGTSDTWIGNRGLESSPPGLCKP